MPRAAGIYHRRIGRRDYSTVHTKCSCHQSIRLHNRLYTGAAAAGVSPAGAAATAVLGCFGWVCFTSLETET